MNSTEKNLMPPPGSAADDARITAALERKLEPQIPADFAAKIAARAAAQPQLRRRHVPRFGSAIALVSLLLAVVALFVLAPHATPSVHNLSFDAELVLLAELAVIGLWFSNFQSRLSR